MARKIEAYEVYDVYRLKGRWDIPTTEEYKGTYSREYIAEEEGKKIKEKFPDESWDFVSYKIKPRLVDERELERILDKKVEDRPSNFIHVEDVDPEEDTCGEIRQLYSSDNLSLAYVNLQKNREARKHKHRVMEEVYYVTRGRGIMNIEGEDYSIERGDTISIPKDKWHYLKSKENSLEVLVVTHPKFMEEDVIEKESFSVE